MYTCTRPVRAERRYFGDSTSGGWWRFWMTAAKRQILALIAGGRPAHGGGHRPYAGNEPCLGASSDLSAIPTNSRNVRRRFLCSALPREVVTHGRAVGHGEEGFGM